MSWRCTARRAGTAPGERMGSHAWRYERGISTEGVLPGKLRVPRRAAALRRMLVSHDNHHDPWRLLTGSTCLHWQ
ncbi:hypothetical protein ACLK1T_19090 [Escherichia coli]